jgi:hypothetical protein
VMRLFIDIPSYGLYAVRDASMFLETTFLLLGFVWAKEKRSVDSLMKWLMVIFAANTIYSYLFPWAEALAELSPKSGIFLEVPLLGTYGGNDTYLLVGALYCVLVARYAVSLPRWILLLLAAVQLLGTAILQARTVYLGLFVCLIVILLVGEIRAFIQLTTSIGTGMLAIMLMTSVVGLEFTGRVGPVRLDFLKEHARSLFGDPNAPAAGTISDRMDWYHDVLSQVGSGTGSLFFGTGFGRPLIDFSVPAGVAVRQPHNSHLSVLARLGAVGFAVWVFLHILIVKAFVYALWARRGLNPGISAMILWLFLFYIVVMIDATVQPGLEFSNGAIPVYFLMGFALGVIRLRPERYVDPFCDATRAC